MKAVIMAGGAGTRFWPMSTEELPKQFLRLTSGDSMLRETYNRFRNWLAPEQIYVVTMEKFRLMVLEELPEIGPEQLIIEPCRRDTGPCLAMTALHFLNCGDDEVLVTAPSDQYIPDAELLRNVLERAEEGAKEDRIITTLGIVPSRPETGYGYIESGEELDGKGVFRVKSFMEKPSREKAQQLVQESSMFWNSGIFIWKPSTIAHYMAIHQPGMWQLLSANMDALPRIYPELPAISVDYAILEKADRILMIPFPGMWDDVGSWTSLERIQAVDDGGNIVIGDIRTLSSMNNIVWTGSQKTVLLGVSDLIVVSTDKGLLVCHKSQEQLIKKIIQSL